MGGGGVLIDQDHADYVESLLVNYVAENKHPAESVEQIISMVKTVGAWI